MIETKELYWVAGFLEGEGCFATERNTGSIRIRASQLQREPLERLRSLLGGTINGKWKAPGLHRKLISNWCMSGPRAAGWMMMLFPIMSPRRQEQMKAALKTWKSWPIQGKYKTHCLNGHPLHGDNIRVRINPRNGSLTRDCLSCDRQRAKKQRAHMIAA